jgi:hypothetical protein
MFKEMIELDAEKEEYNDDKFFKKLLTNIHANMGYEETPDADNENI